MYTVGTASTLICEDAASVVTSRAGTRRIDEASCGLKTRESMTDSFAQRRKAIDKLLERSGKNIKLEKIDNLNRKAVGSRTEEIHILPRNFDNYLLLQFNKKVPSIIIFS